MYKISVPISLESISDKFFERDLNKYLDYFERGNVERVFIAVLQPVYTAKIDAVITSDKIKKTLAFFKEHGLEVGVWIGGFGHGSVLTHDAEKPPRRNYVKQAGVLGESYEHGYCPLDENFAADYLQVVSAIAKLNPDIIMLDDDYRLNGRPYHMGCFCEKHLEEFYKLIGEKVPREDIERLVFTGGKNKYRDAYMDLSKKTLVDFAKRVRKTIDSVNPKIRAGVCMLPETWDLEGTDGIVLARAFAGNTKPFVRPISAPYHNAYCPIEMIENQRLQANWVKNSGNDDIEVFAEGDVYPRPTYCVPSKALELYDLALAADNGHDGCLKYMFPYEFNIEYDDGYIKNHIKNVNLKKEITDLFKDKTITGIPVFGAMHKVRDFIFPDELREKAMANKAAACYKAFSTDLLSKNSIPTCYIENEYPVIVCGESARYIPLNRLKNGAILDCKAAVILKERGLDTGILSVEEINDVRGEYYIDADEKITRYSIPIRNKIACDEKAAVSSVILPYNTPGAYTYENTAGTRFFVLAADFEHTPGWKLSCGDSNYFNNFLRQKQVVEAIEWISGKKLPTVSMHNPYLYIIAAKNDNSMSVLVENMSMDDVIEPEILLDREYKTIKCVGCTGTLCNGSVHLSDIPSYGVCAFEVSL